MEQFNNKYYERTNKPLGTWALCHSVPLRRDKCYRSAHNLKPRLRRQQNQHWQIVRREFFFVQKLLWIVTSSASLKKKKLKKSLKLTREIFIGPTTSSQAGQDNTLEDKRRKKKIEKCLKWDKNRIFGGRSFWRVYFHTQTRDYHIIESEQIYDILMIASISPGPRPQLEKLS